RPPWKAAAEPSERPRPDPPRHHLPSRRPGGLLVDVKVRLPGPDTDIRVRVKVDTPRSIPFRGPGATPRHVRHKVPHQATKKAGRHGRLKPGSREPRD
ncbi:hypothetical protein, partial [Actinomadura sp. KC216]|uniref:hypothetical protein n=1 Tax=Actinomadura sp. KC216 TaxID=2530370 RepID=UPI001A9D57E7